MFVVMLYSHFYGIQNCLVPKFKIFCVISRRVHDDGQQDAALAVAAAARAGRARARAARAPSAARHAGAADQRHPAGRRR